MVAWNDFSQQAPRIAELFIRRHRATGNLCLLGTTRADGYPRISPMEPRITGDHLAIVGMPGTTKFRDLERDPRFCLHTATIDPHVEQGDVKLFGRVENLKDEAVHRRFADELFDESGFDLRGQSFDPFFVADLIGASALRVEDGKMLITIWKPAAGERERVLDG